MRALVTGGGGFLGQYIVERLISRGDIVRVLARQQYPGLAAQGVETIHGDLRDRDTTISACQNIDIVFHVAAKVDYWGKREDFRDINIKGTQHIIDGCGIHGVKRLVYTSSPSVVFDHADLCNVDETCPYPKKYTSHYAATKSAAEQLVIASNKKGKLLTVALRPHLIWGPGDTHLVPGILENAKKGRLRIIGRKQVMTDFTYVENVADAHLLAGDRLADSPAVAGQVYFISQGEPVYMWGFVNQVLESLNISPVSRRVSSNVAHLHAGISELLYKYLPLNGEPRLTHFLVGQLSHSHYFDISKARRDLDYQPRVSVSEGIDRMVASLHQIKQ